MLVLSLAQRGIGLITLVALARLIDARGLGAYTFALNSSQTFQNVSRLGIDAGLHISLSRLGAAGEFCQASKERAAEILGEAFALTVGLSLLAALVMTVFSGIIADRLFAAPELAPYMIAGGAMTVGQGLAQFSYAAFAGLNAFSTFSRLSIFGSIATLLCVPLGAWTFGASGATWALAGSQCANSFLLLWGLQKECKRRGVRLALRVPYTEAASLLQLGLPFFLGAALLTPAAFYSLGLVGQSEGVAALGDLRAVQTLMSLAVALPTALSGPLITYLSERHAAGNGGEAAALQLRFVWVFGLLIGLTLAAVFPAAVHLVFGRSFELAGRVGVLAIAPFLATMVLSVVQGSLLAQKRSGVLFFISSIMAACLVLAARSLVPHFGLAGLFLSEAASFGLGALLICGWLHRKGNLPIARRTIAVLLVCTSMTLALLIALAFQPCPSLVRLISALLTAILVGTLCLFGVFSQGERLQVGNLSSRAKRSAMAFLQSHWHGRVG